MINFQIDLQQDTEKKFKKILSFYSDKDTLFRNFINFQINNLQNEIINFKEDIKAFEKKYGISSDKFYEQYKSGKTDDSHDTLLWAGLCEMLSENTKKINVLQ